MQRPFYSVQKQYLEGFRRINETQKFQFEYYDGFILWIIGFSVAGLTLIISNVEKLLPLLMVHSIFWILGFLILSMISGILYRMYFFVFRYRFLSSLGFIEAAFFEQEGINHNAEDLSDQSSVDELLYKLKEYFGIDQYEFVKGLGNISDVEKSALKKTLLDSYKRQARWAKKDFYLGHVFSRDTIYKAFDVNRSQVKKFLLNQKKYNFFLFSKVTSILLLITISSFVISILIFIISFCLCNY